MQARATKSAKINNLSPKVNNKPLDSVFNLAFTNLVKSNIALEGKRKDTRGPGRQIKEKSNYTSL